MKIKVVTDKEIKEILCMPGQSVLDALKDNEIYVPAYCGGRGVCGKCGIQLLKGSLPPVREDRQCFDDGQIKDGFRLSCKAYPEEDIEIALLSQKEDNFEILSGGKTCRTLDLEKAEDFGIAVDIGTTTIAMELIERASGCAAASFSCINRQRAYGADVISRIQASNNGEGEALRKSIVRDLSDGFAELLRSSKISPSAVKYITVSANTTMCHLLLGYSCETLGVFPFTPVNIKTTVLPYKTVFDSELLEAEVIVLPGISTYVGADIASGLLALGFDRMEKPSVLIDLGTNGEMAVGCSDRLICTSTAAGPAFEGGNISCGIGSVAGAVCAVQISGDAVYYETIGSREPVGICGTGVLDITAELLKHDLIDETGLLDAPYFEGGLKIADGADGRPITFTQKDIREIQLAKAAVRAGLEVLLKRFGISCEDVDKVYLAGGFGFRLDIDKAVSIGLLPEAFKGKIRVAGNTSLKGAAICAQDREAVKTMEEIIGHCEEISLGSDAQFNEAYMDAMFFERS